MELAWLEYDPKALNRLQAFQYGDGEQLPLQVLQSNTGFYIGTKDSEGAPNSRESAVYWKKALEAQAALDSGNWVQKLYP